MFGSSKLSAATNTTFKKDDYKKASFISKYFTYSWTVPLFNAELCDKKMTYEDFPDMIDKRDYTCEDLELLTQNF
jgi:hypothetical protein